MICFSSHDRLRLILKRGFFPVLPLLIVLLLAGCAEKPQLSQGEPDCLSKGWPHERSDLEPDPALVFGTLPNGLRYVIMENNEPRDRVGVYLNIQAGSLHETEEQRGLAHYLEHMLFNGTTHFPPGTLIEYFQSIGMGFGADSNAHTGFSETVYKLLLPSGDREVLDEGLLVIADYARGALLLEKEVDDERGIILAEKRARDSSTSRVRKERLKFDFAGTRIAEREPIGLEEVLRTAGPGLLRSYYDAWYRPENMIVVVVGDLDMASAEELIEKHMAPLTGATVDRQCPPFGRIDRSDTDVFYLHEPDLGHTEIVVQTLWNSTPLPDTRQHEHEELRKYVASAILNNRLKQLISRPGTPLTKTQAYAGVFQQRIGYATITAQANAADWQKALLLVQQSLQQVIQDGFTAPELVRVKKEILSHLEQQVLTRESRDSGKIAQTIINKINDNEVILSPEQELALYAPLLEEMTLDEANTAFRDLWRHDNRLIAVVGTTDLQGLEREPADVIKAVWTEGVAKQISPWVAEDSASFPYLELPGELGEIIGQDEDGQLAVHSYRLAGGVILHVKKTDFKNNEVNIALHFGNGSLSQPQAGMGMLAESVVSESGFGALTRDQLAEALAGTTVQHGFLVGPESFTLKGSGLKSEFELIIQLLYTALHDPAFRPSAYSLSMERFAQMYESLAVNVEGRLKQEGNRFLAGDNPRYGIPAQEDFMRLGVDDIQSWLEPIFQTAPLEITVVGDVERDEVLELIRRYFGAEKRSNSAPAKGEKIVFPSGEKLKLTVQSEISKAVLVVAWPTDDFWDISRTRRLNVLASVLDDRLRRTIREELGATYSPRVYNMSSRVDPGYGVLQSIMIVDPTQVAMLAKTVHEVAADMAEKGIDDEELQRSVQPVLTSIRDMMRTNRYWLESVLSLSDRHPVQLQWPLTIQEDFAAITAEDISELAARYLDGENAAEIWIVPTEQ